MHTRKSKTSIFKMKWPHDTLFSHDTLLSFGSSVSYKWESDLIGCMIGAEEKAVLRRKPQWVPRASTRHLAEGIWKDGGGWRTNLANLEQGLNAMPSACGMSEFNRDSKLEHLGYPGLHKRAYSLPIIQTVGPGWSSCYYGMQNFRLQPRPTEPESSSF